MLRCWPDSSGRWGRIPVAGKKIAKAGAKKGAATAKAPPAMKYLQIRLTEPSWRELRMLSLEAGESMQTLVVAALNALMVKHGKKPVIAGPSEDEE
jgi:hypothetical protein